MLRFFPFLLLGLFPFFSLAHQGQVQGIVKDAKTGIPLAGATLQIQEISFSTQSNATGFFQFTEIPTGKYTLRVSVIGYQTETIDFISAHDAIVRLDFALNTSEISLDEVIISSSNPQNQSLISSIDILLRPIQNSQEILRSVPGLFIGQHAGGGKAEQIFLRGFDIDHGTDIALSVDGVPINMVSHAHGQGYADAHFIIPELLEKVDFKKGMYDADKGNFATAGWVNFQTKKVLDENFVKAEAGQFQTYRLVGGVKFPQKTGKNNTYLSGEYTYSDSFFESSQRFNRLNLFGRYHGHITPKTNLTVTASTFWSRWDASGQIPERAVNDGSIGFFGAIDPTEGGETARTNIYADFVTTTKQNHVWKNLFYYSNYHFELFSNFTFFLEDPVRGDQIKQKEKRNLWGYQSNYAIFHELAGKSATLSLGTYYRHDLVTGSELSRTANRTELLERLKFGDIQEANMSAFIEENISLSNQWSITAGLRYEYFKNQYIDFITDSNGRAQDSQLLLPKLNVYYTPNPNLQFYFTNGKGFHSNDTRVVVPQNGLRILPPAYGSDLGVIIKPVSKLLINTSVWYLWLDQEFVYVGDAAIVEESGRTRRLGIDVSARYQLLKNLFIDTDLNWAKPRAVDEERGENFIPLAVPFASAGGVTLKKEKGLSGSFRYRYLANRPANEDFSIVAKGYWVNDLLIQYNRNKITYGVSVHNIFNVRWKETQFATLSRLKEEDIPVEEIHFTPGTPFNARAFVTIKL
ncbi:MAG: TonB-dependent receptor [Spirosomataceae bacterium]